MEVSEFTKPLRRMKCSVVVSLICSVLCGASDGAAQSRSAPLPDLQQGAKGGVIVTAEHVAMYRDLLPEPLFDLVAAGEFSFEAALRPRNNEVVTKWYAEGATQPTMAEDGGIVTPPGSSPPFLFTLPAGALPTASTAPDEVVAVARRILWNSQAWMWSKRSITQRLLLSVFGDPRGRPKQVEFDWERVYPQTLGPVPGSIPPLFREKVSARVPKILEGLAYLTLRFVGSEEDRMWIASPVTQRVRQVTGSNRSDVIFSGGFSLDELMVWSGKIEMLEPKILSRREFLVPLLDRAPISGSPLANGCSKASFEGGEQVVLNYQSKRFPSLTGWVPTNVLFVKRPLYRIELTTKDPFSLDARQVVYVDAESFLPIYRVSWDLQGRARRFSMGIIGAVSQPNGEAAPIVRGYGVVDLGGRGRSIITSRMLEVCPSYVPGRELKNFDPSTMITVAPKSKPQEAKEGTVRQEKVRNPTSLNGAQGEPDERAGLD